MKIAVVSGKGGSGKSSVTAALVALSPQVVAVDCDVDASNLPLLFSHHQIAHERFASGEEIVVDAEACVGCGLCVDKCAFHALELNGEGIAQPVSFQCEGCGLCVSLCPQQALSIVPEENSDIFVSTFAENILVHGCLCPGDDNSGKMIARIREIADEEMAKRKISLQLLDGPPGIGCPVLSTVTGVDCVVMVCEPTLSGIADLQRIYTVASSFCAALKVIINKCDINPDNYRAILDFCQHHDLPVIAELPFDKRLVEAQLHCQSIVTYAPDSPCSQALAAAYHRLVADL